MKLEEYMIPQLDKVSIQTFTKKSKKISKRVNSNVLANKNYEKLIILIDFILLELELNYNLF